MRITLLNPGSEAYKKAEVSKGDIVRLRVWNYGIVDCMVEEVTEENLKVKEFDVNLYSPNFSITNHTYLNLELFGVEHLSVKSEVDLIDLGFSYVGRLSNIASFQDHHKEEIWENNDLYVVVEPLLAGSIDFFNKEFTLQVNAISFLSKKISLNYSA